jgi:hypothetical protein
VNFRSADCFALKRVAIKEGTTSGSFKRICWGKGLLFKKSEDSILATGKSLLGDSRYDRLRSKVLSLRPRKSSEVAK